MGLRGSIIGSQRIKGGSGFANSGCNMRFKLNRISPSISIQRATQKPTSSTPEGYRIPLAVLFPIKNGGISARVKSTFDVSASVIGDGYISVTENVTFSVSAAGDLLASIGGEATVTFSVLCDMLGFGFLTGSADISAQPTAADIAGEFFATFIDGSYTMKDVLKILSSVAAGKTTITDLGGGNATVEFRNISDTETTVIADMNGSERNLVNINT